MTSVWAARMNWIGSALGCRPDRVGSGLGSDERQSCCIRGKLFVYLPENYTRLANKFCLGGTPFKRGLCAESWKFVLGLDQIDDADAQRGCKER
ncbi:hypothetical protein Ancab_026833 [Ancistrocladus abbreviatus]